MTDSADELYTISIIPKDTFSFSVQHGFKGKAEKIELPGQLRPVINRIVSAVLRMGKKSGRIYGEKELREKSALSNTKVLESKS